MSDGVGTAAERLSLSIQAGAPLPSAQLSESKFKGSGKRRHLVLLPLAHKIPWQPMYTRVIGRRAAWGAFHDDEHVIGDEAAAVAKGVPHRAPYPAATLEARDENMIEGGSPLGRAVGEAFRPMRPGELPLSVIEAQVDDAQH